MPTPREFFAIDPGKTGAIAVFHGGQLTCVLDPQDESLSTPLLDELQHALHLSRVVIEKVQGIPRQSGPASFEFGRAYGELLGICACFGKEPILVPASVWKPALGLKRMLSDTGATHKAKSRAKAAELFPTLAGKFKRAKDDGRAEAALLGHYALTQGIFA